MCARIHFGCVRKRFVPLWLSLWCCAVLDVDLFSCVLPIADVLVPVPFNRRASMSHENDGEGGPRSARAIYEAKEWTHKNIKLVVFDICGTLVDDKSRWSRKLFSTGEVRNVCPIHMQDARRAMTPAICDNMRPHYDVCL